MIAATFGSYLFFCERTIFASVNAKNIAILAALALAGVAVGMFARGFSDAKLWTNPA